MHEKRRGRTIAPFFILALFAGLNACATSSAVSDDALRPPARVLFVGNSFTYYNNSLHNHYRNLVAASGYSSEQPPRVRIMTISGGHLPEHASGLRQLLESESWDVVVLQGHSRGPISEATAGPFQNAARDFASMIRRHSAEPVFFMTWAYTGKPEMTAQLNDAYTQIGTELDARVVPVGLAFAIASTQRPTLSLRVADGRHPSLAGTYLAACTFYSVLYGKSAKGLKYSAGLDQQDAAYLQSVAWRAVTEYAAR